jgi:hypothetical protein
MEGLGQEDSICMPVARGKDGEWTGGRRGGREAEEEDRGLTRQRHGCVSREGGREGGREGAGEG